MAPPHRKPWCILETLSVPLMEPSFAKWARGQLLRLASAIFRRYEVKHAGYPYCLWPMASCKHSDAQRSAVAQRLLQEPRHNLDTYAAGVRALFATEEALLSQHCQMVLSRDFSSQGYGTDCVERANAELTATTPKRAPGRNFCNAAREAMLRQLTVVHRSHGGTHPLASGALQVTSAHEEVQRHPFLRGVATPALGGLPQTDAPLVAASPRAGTPADAVDAMEIQLQVVEQQGHMVFAPEVETRKNPALLSDAVVPNDIELAASAPQANRGLSPYMLECNRHLQAARVAKGSTLTRDEVARARAEFRNVWQGVKDRSVFSEAYNEWRHTGRPSQESRPPPKYKLVWGGGCHATPITKEELWEHVHANGWPSDAQARPPPPNVRVPADQRERA